MRKYIMFFLLIASVAFCAADQPTNKSVQGIIDWSLVGGFIESGDGVPTASATEGNLYVDISDPLAPELWRYTDGAWAKIAGGGGFDGDVINIPYTTATPTVSTDAITLWADDNGKVLRAYDGSAWHDLWTPVAPPAEDVVALLHLNDNLTDETGNQTWSGSVYSYNAGKFGNCALFSGGSLTPDPTTAFDDPGNTEVFTVDFWVKFVVYSQNMYLCGNSKPTASEGWHISMTNAEPAYFQVKGVSGTWGQDMISTGTISTGQWYHVELGCGTETAYLFIDGNLVDTCSRGDIVTSTNPFKIADNVGLYPDAANFGGYIDEFRYSSVLRHTEAFTPPTNPY